MMYRPMGKEDPMELTIDTLAKLGRKFEDDTEYDTVKTMNDPEVWALYAAVRLYSKGSVYQMAAENKNIVPSGPNKYEAECQALASSQGKSLVESLIQAMENKSFARDCENEVVDNLIDDVQTW